MSTINPTLSQYLAGDTQRGLAVTAGAGTGKTASLTRRILNILKTEKTGLDRIVVVTFTEKAAAELKERIYYAIDKEADKDPEGYFGKMKKHFSANYIGTFHSFCASMLREYPVEAGLDPFFRVLDENDKTFFLRRVIYKKIGELAALEQNKAIQVLSADLTRGEIASAVYSIIQNREAIGNWLESMPERTLTDHYNKLENYQRIFVQDISFTTLRQGVLQDINKNIITVLEKTGDTETKYALNAINLKRNISQFILLLKQAADGIVDFTQILELRNKLDKGCSPKSRPPKDWKELGFGQIMKNQMLRLSLVLNDFDPDILVLNREHEEITFNMSKALAEITAAALSLYDEEKRRQNYLDFQDLQLSMYRLLHKGPQPAEKMAARFDHIMVDEFQDTNSLQWGIVSSLAKTPDGRFNPEKIFIVGDEKQSIYSFRGGDVALFSRTRNVLGAENVKSGLHHHPFNLNTPGLPDYTPKFDRALANNNFDLDELQKGTIKFMENFRSAELPIQFFNLFFKQLFEERNYETYQARHQNLIQKGNMSQGSVELFLVDSDFKEEAPVPKEKELEELNGKASKAKPKMNGHQCEAVMIAAKIREVLEGTDPRYDSVRKAAEEHRPAIAVLLSRRTKMGIYEEVFREQQINFIVVGGRGFYQRQEIIDIANLCDFLENRTHSDMLAGVLRSDYFQVSDGALLQLSRALTGDSLWENLVLACNAAKEYTNLFSESDYTAITRAFRLLNEWSEQKDTLPLPEFLDQVMDELYMFAGLSRGSRGRQAVSNMEKLMEKVRNFYIREQMDFYTFTDWLSERVNYIENEGEADVDLTQGGVVQLMTIHASKGLEFPMVFLPDLSVEFNLGAKEELVSDYIPVSLKIDGNSINRETAFELSLSAPDPGDRYKKKAALVKKIIQYWRKQKLVAERKRLLYVAATRTRDHLILAGQIKSKSTRRIQKTSASPINKLVNWTDWICKILNIYPALKSKTGTLILGDRESECLYLPYTRYVENPSKETSTEEYRTEFPLK